MNVQLAFPRLHTTTVLGTGTGEAALQERVKDLTPRLEKAVKRILTYIGIPYESSSNVAFSVFSALDI
jgi:hypothetical protein